MDPMPAGKKKLLIGTSNSGKYGEMMEVLHDLPFEFLRPQDLKLAGDADESGHTYEENALKKATHYFEQCHFMTLAEDSGIIVDALSGELGVKTRRWGAGEKASDTEWIEYFLDVMKKVPDAQRTARFICCSAVIDEKGQTHFFRGETEGIITRSLEAPIRAGLPLSSCFRPVGFKQVYAALTIPEKNGTSHRGKAMKQVHDFLQTVSIF
jgi:XTP/dITP diphosphohydrolase